MPKWRTLSVRPRRLNMLVDCRASNGIRRSDIAPVPAGGHQEMIWQIARPEKFHYACLLPGHFEAEMSGKITVTKG